MFCQCDNLYVQESTIVLVTSSRHAQQSKNTSLKHSSNYNHAETTKYFAKPVDGDRVVSALDCYEPDWAALIALGKCIHYVRSLIFTFGATPANLLMATMAASHCSPHACFSRGRVPDSNGRPPVESQKRRHQKFKTGVSMAP